MKRPLVLIFLNLTFFTVFSWFTRPVLAEGEFTSRYDINYEVESSGITNVSYQVNITNLTTQYYLSEYELIIPSAKIEDVRAGDQSGTIIPQVIKDENSTKIHLTFNEKVVGKGRILAFAFTYKSPEIAQKVGRIWEIALPPKAANPEITEYNVELKVPKSFGQPAYAFPQPNTGLVWTGEQMKSGAVITFGDYQLFNFKLSYHLANTKLFPFYTEIALPSDNPYQSVRIEEIVPKPVSIREDEDDNWMARYDLSPGAKIDIQVSGLVKLVPFPDQNYPKKTEKPSRYLTDQKFWELTDSEVQKLAKDLKTPRAIYDYVVSTLKYDYQRAQEGGKRLGAKEALKNPEKAICMEFTDLFVALARAAGIPAREVDGFAYTTNSKLRPLSLKRDILHAWPQFWDDKRQTWVMVDPTWGATTGGIDYFQKLDFNHFALAVRGVSSEMPVPAGGYKIDGSDSKDVEVEFAPGDWQAATPRYEVNWNLPAWVITGFGINGFLEIKNVGAGAVYDKKITVGSIPEGLVQSQPLNLNLAPGQNYKLNLEFKKQGWFENFSGMIVLSIDGKTFSQPFRIKSFGWTIILPFASLCVLITAVIFALKLRRRQKPAPIAKNEPTKNQ